MMKTKWTPTLLREFEERVAKEFEEGKISCPVHLSGGNESQLISIFELINEEDYIISTHRNHYHYLLKGGNDEKLMAELRGDNLGVCNGCGRSMHIFDSSINFLTSGIVAGGCSIACGIGLAIQKELPLTKRNHVWCFVGDGAEDSGHFTEAVRFAGGRKLPVTFIIEDNDLSIDIPKVDRWKEYSPITAENVIRYNYKRRYPHVGVGKHVTF
jgi:pyruvate dehydrogenase E1 component alpha subunit